MNLEAVERIANAVLYEGYILYPYRPSAVKNRQRFNFGVLYPEAYARSQKGADSSSMQTECLVIARPGARLDLKVRFLHLVEREIKEGAGPDCRAVDSIEVDGQIFQSWQEAVERDASVPTIDLNDSAGNAQRHAFSFGPGREVEPLRGANGEAVASIVRRQEPVEGVIELKVEPVSKPQSERHLKITARVLNTVAMEEEKPYNRDRALLKSLVSAHTILAARGGEFVSLLDPPAALAAAASSCRNLGTWPVLVGEEGARDLMLSSPIILYDYPQIAPESAGDLFDGTEIDELLTLRIMTLTDEEKREMRNSDERARRILERTEALSFEQMWKLHGAVRGLRRPDEDET